MLLSHFWVLMGPMKTAEGFLAGFKHENKLQTLGGK